MYPTNTPQNQDQLPTSDQQTIPEWFKDTEPPQPTRNNRPILITVCIVIVALVAAGSLAFLTRPSSKIAGVCLEKADYTTLAAALDSDNSDNFLAETDVQADSPLYTQSIYFEKSRTDYLQETANDTPSQLKTIAAFYKEHTAKSRFNITISTDYLKGESSTTASQRLQKVKQSLVEAGVTDSSIILKEPTPVTPEDDYISGDIPVTLSLSSPAKCQ